MVSAFEFQEQPCHARGCGFSELSSPARPDCSCQQAVKTLATYYRAAMDWLKFLIYMEEIKMRAKKRSVRLGSRYHQAEDADLENRIANFLHLRHIPNSKQVQANARVGTVVVSGKLPSRHAKWQCLQCCRHVAGVIKLIDKVVVEPGCA